MAIFKEHKVSVVDLLNVIPEALLSHLSQTTTVDYYSKILHGKKMFYLLMYGILESDRLSQRTLEEIFNDSVFKMLFNLEQDESVRRSSLSERLSKIDPDYFRQIYEHIYDQFSGCYLKAEQQQYNIVRVDSTIISDTSGKIVEGLDYQNNSGSSKKAVKYSMAFDGILPCDSKVFTESTYSSEDMALPEIVRSHVKQQAGHRNMYVLDRGLQSARNMRDFSEDNIPFIARVKENRKYVELESNLSTETDLGELTLIVDSKVQLYTNIATKNKQGKTSNKYELVKQPFRLIVVKSKDDIDTEYWFVTNDFELSAKQICDYYKRRWDIEVFFRFIKQELHTSHLISLNQNGIQVMLYMTLIVAMLVLIYKRANNIGYKTAKRRFKMEIRDLIIALIVIQCGGDPTLFFKTKKE